MPYLYDNFRFPPKCANTYRGQISRDWARRVILAVGEREARLEAAERFRISEPPRFVCPECHEFGCSSASLLDEHLRDESWHDIHVILQVFSRRVQYNNEHPQLPRQTP